MSAPVVVLDGGTSYHNFSLSDPLLGTWFDERIYVEDVSADNLGRAGTIVIPCRLNPDRLKECSGLLTECLNQGKTLIAMGETEPQTWLRGIDFTPVPTNFWWWLEPDGDLGLKIAAPDHGLFDFLTMAEATWHYHGTFRVPSNALSLIDAPDGGSILVDDDATWQGRLLLTSLDPFYHHGSFFMPAATRFLVGFTQWIEAGMPAHQEGRYGQR
ncbi:MAG: hypothetical protein AAF414_21400 [Pseudomonadota bacterium]